MTNLKLNEPIDQLITYQMFLFPLIVVMAIPFTFFILHLLFHKHTPSMLKRVGAGTIFCIMALIWFIVIYVVGHAEDKTAVCMLQINSTSSHLLIDVHFSLLPYFLEKAGCSLIELYSLEFTIAQASAMMKGFIIVLWYSGQAFAHLVFFPFSKLFLNFIFKI